MAPHFLTSHVPPVLENAQKLLWFLLLFSAGRRTTSCQRPTCIVLPGTPTNNIRREWPAVRTLPPPAPCSHLRSTSAPVSTLQPQPGQLCNHQRWHLRHSGPLPGARTHPPAPALLPGSSGPLIFSLRASCHTIT